MADIVEQVLERDSGKIYDNIIVVKAGLLIGTVSVHSLLEKQAEMIKEDTLS